MASKRYTYIFLGLALIYAIVALGTPSNPAVLHHYHLTQTAARLLSLTIVLPVIGIWLAAYYGFMRIKSYAATVDTSQEGKPFNTIANGLMILVFSLPISSVVSAALNYIAWRHMNLIAPTTIIRNYVGICLSVVAFYLISRGAARLGSIATKRQRMLGQESWVIGAITGSSLLSWLVVTHTTNKGQSIFYLPTWLVTLTIVIPYVYMWYCGLTAAYCLFSYHRNVKGILYRRALSYISIGIALAVTTAALIQFLTIFGSHITRFGLEPILATIYGLVVIYAAGYLCIARGARKLKVIEDV